MSKKWGVVLGAITAVGLIASVLVGGALAQGITPQSPQATPQAGQPALGRGAPGAGGPADSMSDIAKLLDMTLDQIWAERVQGKTLADLAKEKGVDTQKLADVLVEAQKTKLDQAVTDNRLTQAQADKWLDWYKQSAALQLTEPYGPGFGMGGMRGGPGGHGGPGGMRGQGPMGQEGSTPPQPQATPTK